MTKPLPMAHGHRIRSYALSGSGIGVGPLGGFAGYALVGVMDDRGLRKLALRADSALGLLPGNARETWAEGLLEVPEYALGDRGSYWGLVARVNLILKVQASPVTLAHNLICSYVLHKLWVLPGTRMAGVGL